VNSPSRISVFGKDLNVESSKVFAYNDFRLHGEEVGSVSVSTKHVQTCWAVRIGWLEMAGLAWAEEAFILKGKERGTVNVVQKISDLRAAATNVIIHSFTDSLSSFSLIDSPQDQPGSSSI